MSRTCVVTQVGPGKDYCLGQLLAGWDDLRSLEGDPPLQFLVVAAGDIAPDARALLERWSVRPRRKVVWGPPPVTFEGQVHPRNRCAAELRERARPHLVRRRSLEWVLWVDSDVLCEPDTLVRLRSHGRPVVSGVVMDRLDVCAMAFSLREGLVPVRPGPQAVDWTGFGCILTRADLVREIGWGPYLAGEGRQDLGEDGYWCVEAAARTGQRVLLDGDVRPVHVHHTGLGSRAAFATAWRLRRELRFAGGLRLLSNHSGWSPSLGDLRAGEFVETDVSGRRLADEELRALAARSTLLELVEAV